MKNRLKNMRRLHFALLAVLLFSLSGCHHPRSVSKTKAGKLPEMGAVHPLDAKVEQLFAKLHDDRLAFSELAAKLKTRVASPSMNQSFTTNIRWKKGEKIWMSMSIIGIEGARVLITRDSIKIMDKINERYILKPLSYIKEKTYVDLSFSDIENLLLGQLIFTDTAHAKYADNPSSISISADGARFLSTIVFEKNTKELKSMLINDKLYTQTVEAVFDNYQPQLGKPFSMDRNLRIRSGYDLFEMEAHFQAIELKQNQEYPFTINPSYTIEK